MAIPQLAGKHVLVTGAGSGIGRATALAFAARGASVVVSDLDPVKLEAVRATLAASGAACFAQVADVTDAQSMQALADAVHALVPALDVLVNNAGIAYIGPFGDTPPAVWEKIFQVNLMGVVHGCQAFLPRMRAAGGARHVLNIASLAGIAPAPNMSAYAASKSAVIGLCDALALELAGSAVRISAVCPGLIDTPITQGGRAASISDAQIARLQAYYRKHGAAAEVVAEAIVRAVQQGQELVLIGPFAKPMYHLKRISRKLVRRLTLGNAANNGFL